MIHLFILVHLLLVLGSLAILVLTYLEWKRRGQAYLRVLMTLEVLMLADLALISTSNYVAINLVGVDPLGVTTKMVYFQRAPLLFALGLVDDVVNVVIPYILFVLLYRLLPREYSPQLRFIGRSIVVFLCLWYTFSNLMMPLFYLMDYHAQELHLQIRRINNTLNIGSMVVAAVLGLLFWLRERSLAEPGKRWLGDRLLGSFLVGFALNLFTSLMLGTSSISTQVVVSDRLILSHLIGGSIPVVIAVNLFLLRYFLYFVRPFSSPDAKPEPEANGALAPMVIHDSFAELYALTDRERQVSDLLLQGLANKEIAHRLGISPGTVKNHITNIFGKLKIDSRFQLLVRLRDHPRP